MKKLFRVIIGIALICGALWILSHFMIFDTVRERGQEIYQAVSETVEDVSGTIEEISDGIEDVRQEQTDDDAETQALHGPYRVVRVVDGDTAVIRIDGTDTKVRFIGVNTPESVHEDESKNTEEGKQASEFTKELLNGRYVYLEYDIDKEDDYGRTLAYIYLEDGVTRVQDELLTAGMATTMTIQPNSKYADYFYELQVAAREAGAGFWATGFFG